ncbi:MAG: glycosyltransferase family 2 protein [Prevotella sp.]|nr:glycosyltransferase family 2 protein [Prevotella sp.]
MLTVSILTPVYGVEKYIEQCARSLFGQSYAQIEYIFVDDCTPDRSISILESLIQEYPERASQIRIIHHEKNRGVGAARQDALMAAHGDYIMFVDSDDFLPENAVEKLIENTKGQTGLTENTQGQADLIDGSYCEWNSGKASEPQRPFTENGEVFLKMLICQNIITNRLWGRLYRRQMIMEHEIFFEEGINYAEDLFWNAQFLYHSIQDKRTANNASPQTREVGNHKVESKKNGNHKVCINDVVYYYRTDNINSYNHNISEKNLLSYFKSTRHLIDFFEKYDTANTYRRAIDIGVVNAYRWARNAKISLAQVDKSLNYIPHSRLIRLVIQLIKWGIPANCINLLYLSYRRLLGTK